jgi:hypothetical protein
MTMKKVICVLATVCGLAVFPVTSALAGGSNGKGGQTITATCTVLGTVTVHASSGQSAWVSNTHYVTVAFSGTFTPTVGAPTSFTKSYGAKHGFGTRYTCTGSQTSPDGTFTFTATVAKTPTH